MWWIAAAQAESWCADELIAHEWGVEVFDGSKAEVVPMPPQMHRAPDAVSRPVTATKTLPADSGLRELPVVFFYSSGAWTDRIPLGFEVGFAKGRASAWYPQVDAVRDGRLAWDALSLQQKPPTLAPAGAPWVDLLRKTDALWVTRGVGNWAESERFLFYEGDTTERPAVVLERGAEYRAGRTHIVLRNTSAFTVHDVMYNADGHTVFAPAIPPGATAGFILEDHRDPDPLGTLRARWVDTTPPRPMWDPCVMMRDPKVPVTRSTGYGLYAAEVDALLSVWGARLVPKDRPALSWREDQAALDAAMPASLYTDMYHWITWRRLGLVIVDNVRP